MIYKHRDKDMKKYKPEGLDFIRNKVRIRDNNTCQMCGKAWKKGKRRFDVHHLDLKMESVRDYSYDSSNMDKMITYCHKCHINLHSVRVKISKGVSKSNIGFADRNRLILKLRNEGRTFAYIGKIVGLTKQGTFYIYKKDIHMRTLDHMTSGGIFKPS